MKQYTFLESLTFALEGIYFAIRDNKNLRIHFIVTILVILASLYFKVMPLEFAILIVMIVLVISAEMVNTALEEVVDLITTEHRQSAKIAKDVAAGMVLVTSIGAALVGIIILYPYLYLFLGY